ncbi:MAG: pyruvate kinase [Campylobacterales bacterium]|jgi:pyruvate kinase
MKKHTKILATVGPACEDVDTIEQMIRAGANLFRLNFSHGTHAYHEANLKRIHEAAGRCGLIVGVLQDISGPKVRIGEINGSVELVPGDTIEFVSEEVVGHFVKPHVLQLSLNQPELLDKVKKGEAIYFADGSLRTTVIEAGGKVVCEVQTSGTLTSRKGVNFPQTSLGIDVLTDKDRADIAWGVKHGVDFMAISFVQTAKDMEDARAEVTRHGGKTQLIAKIEKFDAVENIDEILEASDGLMVARGDLGIEVPFYRVPSIQKMLIRKANEKSKPVITATQMLLSMTQAERATRAEISDVANAVLDGTDCVMLSEESAVGAYPVKAVETMTQTIRETEKIYPYHKFAQFECFDEMDVIDESAVLLSQKIDASAILAMTASGQSAKKLARYRPENPIFAVMHNERIARMLTLVWGVMPAFLTRTSSVDKMLIEVVQSGLARGVLDKDAMYIVTAGDPVGVPGTTNTIRILRKNEMDYFASAPLKRRSKKMPEGSATLF